MPSQVQTLAAKLIKEQPTPQAAAMIAGDRREASADVNPKAEKLWRAVEDEIIRTIFNGK